MQRHDELLDDCDDLIILPALTSSSAFVISSILLHDLCFPLKNGGFAARAEDRMGGLLK
jgi:hypothetical protein